MTNYVVSQDTDAKKVEKLIARLADPKESERIDAISDILFLKYEANINAVIPEFRKLLSDDSIKVRMDAADALVEMDQPIDESLLVTAENGLKHERDDIRIDAAYLMRRLGHHAALKIDSVVPALQDSNDRVRALAAQILGSAGPDYKTKSIPALIQATKDDQQRVRLNAADALTQVDGPFDTAITVIVEVLQQQTEAFPDDSSMGSIGHDAAAILGELGADGGPGVDALIKALDQGGVFRQTNVATALGKIGPAAKPAIAALGRALRNGEPKGMPFVHRSWCASDDAAQALIQLGADSVPVLVAALDDPVARVRANSANALGDIAEDAETVVPKLTACLKDDDASVRAHAAWALGKFGLKAQSALVPLVETLFDETEWNSAPAGGGIAESFSVPWHAVKSIPQLGVEPEKLVAALKDAIEDKKSINFATATIIASIGSDAKPLVNVLRPLLDQPKYRADAGYAIASVSPGSPNVQQALEAALIDRTGDPAEGGKIDRVAARGLGRMKTFAKSSIAQLEAAIAVAEQSEFVGADSEIIFCALAILEIDPQNERASKALLEALENSHGRFDATAIKEAVKTMPEIAKQQTFLRSKLMDQLNYRMQNPPEEWDDEDVESVSRATRLGAARVLINAGIAKTETRDTLMRIIKSGRGASFRGAAELLEKIGPDAEGAMEGLAAKLNDFDRFTIGGDFYGNGGVTYNHSQVAVDALAAIGKPAVPVLIKKLGDSNHRVRAAAITALGKIESLEFTAISALVEATSDPSHLVRKGAFAALGNLEKIDPSTHDQVVDVLKRGQLEPRLTLRQAASKALQSFSTSQ